LEVEKEAVLRAVAATALILIATSTAQARLCVPPTVEPSPYRFLVSMSNALVSAKEGLSRPDSVAQGDAYSLLVALRLQQDDYKCAKSQVEPFVTSGDTVIAASAGHAARIFGRLVQLDDELISLTKGWLEPGKDFSVSAMADRQAKVTSDLEATWMLLVHVATLSTYTVVREDQSTGRMTRLALTAAQRDEILRILRAGFGNEITGGAKEGQHYLVAAAAIIYSVVGDPKRQVEQH
jgi:hypothetical protein